MNINGFRQLSKLVQLKEMPMLRHVKELRIKGCDSLVEVFESRGRMLTKEEYGQNINNYGLQTIKLEDLPKVRSIWGPNIIRHASFGKLTSIEIAGCNNLKCVVPYSVAKSLVELKELTGCKDETLFPKLENLSLEDQAAPQLKELLLSGVPNLQYFCGGSYDYDPMLLLLELRLGEPNSTPKASSRDEGCFTFIFTQETISLSDVGLVELQEVETFECIDEKPQYKHLLGYMSRVTRLHVESCNKLLKCVPSNTIHSLLFQHLKELHVRQCQNIEVVFEGTDTDGIDKSELERMELHSLPKLKHIWRNNNSVIKGFENLRNLIILGAELFGDKGAMAPQIFCKIFNSNTT
ncbi:hypothetical protein PIB30_073125 [Stylosanthes scabra]|uniref:Disease resistance protein At4g27190-like leucine-rich repeats domain-containing protein n=1 Tax=Stylosanthes scabra TaxID=79078 RepID=A0ABU6RPT8_9FABA|nr:hypothetical protein [Stylosanthes scabra]